MYQKLKISRNLPSLTVAFCLWLTLLVITSLIAGLTDYSQTVWAGLIYWTIDGMAAMVATTVAIWAWRYNQRSRFSIMVALGAAAFAAGQLSLRTTPLWQWNHPLAMVPHLLVATFTLGVVLALLTAWQLPAVRHTGLDHSHRFFWRSIILTGASFLILLVTGTVVTKTGAGVACPDWPLCQGEIFPSTLNAGVVINLLHRFMTIAFGVLVAAIILQTRRYYTRYPLVARWSTILGLTFVSQIIAGGLYPLLGYNPVLTFLHLGLTAAIWGSLVVLATICALTLDTPLPISETGPAVGAVSLTFKQKAGVYFKLTKPWIMILLLLTTLTAMFIAAKGLPSIPLLLLTLLGGAMSSGGASVLNSYVDSDIDQLMSRTSRRATVTGLVSPQETLIFGLVLSTLSFLLFAALVNTLSAILSTLGILYYVFFYTLYLKRSTIHNIIIGGAAGAIPPLVGWAAVTNSLELSAFYLFAIIFFWTPPHTWALALMVEKDYAKARVPMLPVVMGEQETTYQILLYSILLITVTLLPFTFGMLGWVYLILAAVLGARFIQLAWQLWRSHSKAVSRKLYKYSQSYLAVLFIVMAIDRALF
ncbi:MAG: protoheme IX farnesyltransferase [Anaerolineales bacterium]|nr:protoheme IX farnesyltransferase [Anaerolineales bacterium]